MNLEVNASAPLYGFDEDGNMAIVGEIEESGNEVLYEDEVDNGLSVNDDLIPDGSKVEMEVKVFSEALEETPSNSNSDISVMSYAADALSVNSEFDPDSCLQYQVSVAGYSGILMIPTSFRESIYIDDDGVMWNVGSSSVVGRLFLNRSVSSGGFEQYIVTVRSILANNASTVYSGGSFSSVTHYYESNSRIVSDTHYGDVFVEDDMSKFANDQGFLLNLYLLIIIFILLGGGIICFSKHSRN